MKLREFAEKMNMKAVTGDASLDKELTGIYIGDLLSWVMSHAGKGDGWITVLTSLNVVAVALLTEVACIIVPEGITVDETTINRAVQEDVTILCSESNAYEISCRAYELFKQS